jgi:hypothetical protein
VEGKLFRSRDDGVTWEPLPALPTSIGAPCAATPGTRVLYVAECGDHFGPLVLAVSADGGDTFAEYAPPTIPPDFYFRARTRLLVHSSAPRMLHLAELLVGQSSASSTGSKGALYVSADAGGSWSSLEAFTASVEGLDFATDPRSATVIYGFGDRRAPGAPSLNVLERSGDGGHSRRNVRGDLSDRTFALAVAANGVPWVSSAGSVYRGSAVTLP